MRHCFWSRNAPLLRGSGWFLVRSAFGEIRATHHAQYPHLPVHHGQPVQLTLIHFAQGLRAVVVFEAAGDIGIHILAHKYGVGIVSKPRGPAIRITLIHDADEAPSFGDWQSAGIQFAHLVARLLDGFLRVKEGLFFHDDLLQVGSTRGLFWFVRFRHTEEIECAYRHALREMPRDGNYRGAVLRWPRAAGRTRMSCRTPFKSRI